MHLTRVHAFLKRLVVAERPACTCCRFSGPATNPNSPSAPGAPLYTYLPPGSSMREPISISLDDPVHIIDAKPQGSKPAGAAAAGKP